MEAGERVLPLELALAREPYINAVGKAVDDEPARGVSDVVVAQTAIELADSKLHYLPRRVGQELRRQLEQEILRLIAGSHRSRLIIAVSRDHATSLEAE